jgi:gliding motility-associated-like protein
MTSFFDVENLDFGAYKIRYEYTDPATNCYNEITDTITISDSPQAEMLFSPQPTDLNNPEIFFRDNSDEEIVSSIWDLGDGTIIYDDLNFYHTYLDTGSYNIKYYVTNQDECTDSAFVTIKINPIYSVFIPDAFTPNNDGDNDVFMPSIIGSSSYNIKIFDRWGGMIYNEDNKMWDGKINGKLVNNGTYSFNITVTDINNRIFTYSGLVNLL